MENLLTILSFQTYRKRLQPELAVANLGKSTHWYYIEETKYPKKSLNLVNGLTSLQNYCRKLFYIFHNHQVLILTEQ